MTSISQCLRLGLSSMLIEEGGGVPAKQAPKGKARE